MGGSQIDVAENKRAGKAEMHDQTDPSRGRGETWYNQLRRMAHPPKAIATARPNNREEEATIHVPDIINSLVVLRRAKEASYGGDIDSTIRPTSNREMSIICDNPPSMLIDLSRLFVTTAYVYFLSGGRYKVAFEPATLD